MLMDLARALEICKTQCGKCEKLKNGIERLEVVGKLVTEVVGKLNGVGTQVSPNLIARLEDNSVQGKRLTEEIKKSALWVKLLYGSGYTTRILNLEAELMNHMSFLNAMLALKTNADVRGVVKIDVEAVKTDMWAFKDEIKSDMGAFKDEMKSRMGAFKDEMKGALRDDIRSDVQVLTHNLKTSMTTKFKSVLDAFNRRLDEFKTKSPRVGGTAGKSIVALLLIG